MTAIAAPTPRHDNALWIAAGVSLAVHAALFAILSLIAKVPPPPPPAPMEVTIADDVGLQPTAPQNLTPPAQSQAPDLGMPEDSAPPAPAPEADPAPAKPKPAASAPAPKPAEFARPQPIRKPAPPQPTRAPAPPAPTGRLANIIGNGNGRTPGAPTRAPRGPALGQVVDNAGRTPNNSNSKTPQGPVLNQQAAMDIASAIQRQIQPCADRQSRSGLGLGAEDIRVTFNLKIGRDGQLSATPRIVRTTGVSDTNRLYAGRVGEIGLNALRQCSPLRLPAQYYSTPTGGWNDINYTWFLKG